MRLGCFGFTKDLPDIGAAGFDFAELDIMELSRMSDAEFDAFVRRAGDSGLDFDAYAGFMPLTERIHDPSFSMERWFEHARRMIDRTARLGAKLWPIGAGKCRSIPENADRQACSARVAEFIGGIADIIAPYGVKLCIEPLGPANSNFLNGIPETAAFARGLERKNAATMCDLRHMVKLNEPWEDIVCCRDDILHAHIDFPLGEARRFPKADDGYDYRPYFDALRRARYAGALTVEATAYDCLARDGRESVRFLREFVA